MLRASRGRQFSFQSIISWKEKTETVWVLNVILFVMVVNSVWPSATISALVSGKKWLLHWFGLLTMIFQRSGEMILLADKETSQLWSSAITYCSMRWVMSRADFPLGSKLGLVALSTGINRPFFRWPLTNSWQPLKETSVLTQAGQTPDRLKNHMRWKGKQFSGWQPL